MVRIALLAWGCLALCSTVASWAQTLKLEHVATIPERADILRVNGSHAYLGAGQKLTVVDVTDPSKPAVRGTVTLPGPVQGIALADSHAYIANGLPGLAIVDVWQPPAPKLVEFFNAGGTMHDVRDVIVGSTNASLFAYVADGEDGIKVLQLTSPESQPNFYGFSPRPRPEFIAHYPTSSAALSLSKGLDRDRGADETGGQIAVFGRKGSRPLNLEEMQRLYLDAQGNPWYVQDE